MKYEINEKIKDEIKKNRLFNWEVAMKMGISQDTFYRWIRTELTQKKAQMIRSAIQELKNENV